MKIYKCIVCGEEPGYDVFQRESEKCGFCSSEDSMIFIADTCDRQRIADLEQKCDELEKIISNIVEEL